MQHNAISEEMLSTLEDLLEQVASAHTKAAAQPILRRLRFEQAQVASSIADPYFRGKLAEAINYATEAAGQVRNKEHWTNCMKTAVRGSVRNFVCRA